MAGRIRTIKPELIEDAKTARLSHEQFRLFVAMILMADDHGNLRADEAQLNALVFWGCESREGIGTVLGSLASPREDVSSPRESSLVTLYTVRGQPYAHLNGWKKHQRIDRPSSPRVPTMEDVEAVVIATPRDKLAMAREDVARARELSLPRARAQDPDPDPDQDPDRGGEGEHEGEPQGIAAPAEPGSAPAPPVDPVKPTKPSKRKPLAIVDEMPLVGTDAHRVWRIITTDALLRPITVNPGDFATRITLPDAYRGVDIAAEVARAAEHASRSPSKYTDGRRFLSNWLRRSADDIAATPRAAPAPPKQNPALQATRAVLPREEAEKAKAMLRGIMAGTVAPPAAVAAPSASAEASGG